MVIGILIALAVFGITASTMEAAVTPFTSAQVGATPVNGYILSTNGSKSTWIANTGGVGGTGSNWTIISGGLRTSTSTDFAQADYFNATSSTAKSTFPLASTTALTAVRAYITQLANLTGNGFVKTGSGNGTLSIDTTTYESGLTASNGITRTVNDFAPSSGYVIPTTTRASAWDYASGTVTNVAMSVPTGFSIAGTPVTTSGTLALTYGSGYEGFLTASGTAWTNFYNTPSTRITAGTGIDWTTNTLNTVLTAGDGLTLTGEDFDCDTASGSVFGCLSSANWTTFNGKVGSSSIDTSAELATILTDETGTDKVVFSASPTLTGTTILTYASTTGVSGTNLNFTNATSTTSFFSGLGRFTNAIIDTLLTAVSATITNLTATNATTTNATSTNMYVGSTLNIASSTVKMVNYVSFTVPATPTTTTATSTFQLASAPVSENWQWIDCRATSGSIAFNLTDTGTNDMNPRTATSTVGRLNLTTNNSYTSQEQRAIEVGAMTNASLTCTASILRNP